MHSIGTKNSAVGPSDRTSVANHSNHPPTQPSSLTTNFSKSSMRSIAGELSSTFKSIKLNSTSDPKSHRLATGQESNSFINIHINDQIQAFTQDLIDILKEKIRNSSIEKTIPQLNYAFEMANIVNQCATTPLKISESDFENYIVNSSIQEKFNFIAKYLGNVLNKVSCTMLNLNKESICELLKNDGHLMDWIGTLSNFLNFIHVDQLNTNVFNDFSQLGKIKKNVITLSNNITKKVQEYDFIDHESNKAFIDTIMSDLLTFASKVLIISGWFAQPLPSRNSSSLNSNASSLMNDQQYLQNQKNDQQLFETTLQNHFINESLTVGSPVIVEYEMHRAFSNEWLNEEIRENSDGSNSDTSEGSTVDNPPANEGLHLSLSSHALFDANPLTFSKSPQNQSDHQETIPLAEQLTARAGISTRSTHSFNTGISPFESLDTNNNEASRGWTQRQVQILIESEMLEVSGSSANTNKSTEGTQSFASNSYSHDLMFELELESIPQT